jgi:hypothetical protein
MPSTRAWASTVREAPLTWKTVPCAGLAVQCPIWANRRPAGTASASDTAAVTPTAPTATSSANGSRPPRRGRSARISCEILDSREVLVTRRD